MSRDADPLHALTWRTTRAGAGWGPASGRSPEARRRRRFPTMADLERAARRRSPRFAFDFVDGGTGEDLGAARNRAALDGVEIVPRYGRIGPVEAGVELFGHRYEAPLGIAPTGNDGVAWPDASRRLAETAAAAGLPYVAGTLASASIEQLADICGDRLWFQLYGMPRDDHRVSIDLVRRAEVAGVQTLVLALDAPVRSKRPRDLRNGLSVPFRPSPRLVAQLALQPAWTRAALRSRVPLFANIARYVDGTPDLTRVAGFVQRELRGGLSWDEVRRFRALWPRALVVKGILHPDDAREAVDAGADGVLVSNHGGRQSDAAPAAIDVLSAVAEAVGDRCTVLFDSGIRSGLDVARALALGADAAFGGRAFLTGLAGAGDDGASYVAELLTEELRTAMAQHGALDLDGLRRLAVRHPTSWSPK
ncbi:alpha-hydroxy acid oxidase [Pseudonocardia sp. KRD291]|uniref:alpha-hydroxy acid oxidase n=1 Tax=Pseudonocardia sp. KRD291 TaxID=2792007 RepID=UPI001C49EF3D|nr:alpha-hydroxy acid oxidase [Pseudonocardia sp. KRD291]MBW0104103.1 alpha-hydroxy-acid oxidizing protein [Pseudonocardia sp. KRD291]